MQRGRHEDLLDMGSQSRSGARTDQDRFKMSGYFGLREGDHEAHNGQRAGCDSIHNTDDTLGVGPRARDIRRAWP